MMASGDHDSDLTGTEARGGATLGVMRYVLAISLALVIVVFAVVVLAHW